VVVDVDVRVCAGGAREHVEVGGLENAREHVRLADEEARGSPVDAALDAAEAARAEVLGEEGGLEG
jgi:hypothetical protein